MAEEAVTVLEEKYMMGILLYLLDRGECKKTDIYNDVSRNPRVPQKLDALESAGLLTQTPSEGRRVVIELTDTGRAVASLVREIAGMMEGDATR